jgi:hypothetical protein
LANCVNCASGMHEWFCLWHEEGGCKENETSETFGAELSIEVPITESTEEKVLRDPVSAGRKRAAVMYAIKAGQVCEWAWSKNCGGGIEPIVGCTGRPASNIHHGPDKSTLNNVPDNISVICTFCHNRWHVANDKYYNEPRPPENNEWLPIKFPDKEIIPLSAKVKATKQEILINEMTIPEGGKDGKQYQHS